MQKQTSEAEICEKPYTIDGEPLYPVSSKMLLPERCGDFDVYLSQGENMVLYASRGELFSEAHRDRLTERGVERLFIRADEKDSFDCYVRDNLGEVLADESIPAKERATVWLDVTGSIARDIFDTSLPKSLNNIRFSRIRKILRQSMRFFVRPDVLKHLSEFVSKGSEHYHHGIGVMVLAANVLNSIDPDDGELMLATCSGAILHDVGKLLLPHELFERKPEDLSADELEQLHSHPVLGVSQCASVQLPQEALHCILFHHEREDGSGFPSQAMGDVLPMHAKLVSLCDEYENLTREQPWRKALTPFEALSRIKDQKDHYSPELIKHLIAVLSRADIM